MKNIFFVKLLLSLIVYVSCRNYELPLKVMSPNERIEMIFSLSQVGSPYYSVNYDGKSILDESHLSIKFTDGELSNGFRITNVKSKNYDETYHLVVGKSSQVRNHYNELNVSLQETDSLKRKLDIILRVYDDGVAFRYRIPKQKTITNFEIMAEYSEFNFPKNDTCWALGLKNFTTNYESEFNKLTIHDIEEGSFIGLPLTMKIDDSTYLALTEANLIDYAGLYLDRMNDENYSLISKLSPLPDSSGVCVKGTTPHVSPWRVIMIGETPGDLIESNIVLNLNEPCAISDPSWIKPGKVAWPWWSGRTVTDVDFEGGMNTATMKHYIDFATDYDLEYLLVDAKWYGHHKDPSQDITATIPEINMPEIIEYANIRNVDVMLWLNWQNTRDQMDKAFPLYEKWGIKGVKVDYMNRDDQEMVNFYLDVVKKAAEHHLLVDFHGAYKPTGIRRTYPNLITKEGVLGLEHTKWSDRVVPEHNVTLPFTRMLAGPMDYTPGAFHNVTRTQFQDQYNAPMAMGTRCHHLAMYVVYESPLQMCSDYPEAYREQLAAEFLRVVPTSWDETIAMKGKIGDYCAIARRHNKDWFIGCMTDWTPRTLSLSLDFLCEYKYNAVIYVDGSDAEINPKNINVMKTKVTASDTLYARMAPGGGYVVHLKPAAN